MQHARKPLFLAALVAVAVLVLLGSGASDAVAGVTHLL